MMRSITKSKITGVFSAICAVLFWLALWQIAYLKVAQELLLVSPARAFARLFELAATLPFWDSVLRTCVRVLIGFLLALTLGTLLAAASARFKLVKILLAPLFGVVRVTPVASFIILALLWFTTGDLPVFIAFLMVVPAIWSNVYAGICSADRDLLEMAGIFKLSRSKVFSAIYIPAVMPHFVSACSVGLGFAWKSAIAAEVICLPKAAIGRQLYNAKIYLETADVFAWTIAVVLLSLLIEKLTVAGIKKLCERLVATRRGDSANA